jgi:hypothetical protein
MWPPCWRRRERYVLRDVDGRVVTEAEGKAIVAERYRISEEVRQARRSTSKAKKLKGADEPAQSEVGRGRSSIQPVHQPQIYPGQASRLSP